jgi:hypothetical protein
MRTRNAGLALLFAMGLSPGCGGGGGGSTGGDNLAAPPADWKSSTPITMVSPNITDIEVSGAVTSTAGAEVVETPSSRAAVAVQDDPCHPHLFQRTFEVSDILNRHTHRMMDRIAAIIAHPKALDGSAACQVDNKAAPTQISCTIDPAAGQFGGYPLTLTWQKTAIAGATEYATHVYMQASSTPAADLHQCELGATVTPAPTLGACNGGTCPTCTTVFSSTLDVTTNANGFDVSSPADAPMAFDFSSLHAVDPSELATGTFSVNVDFAKDTTKPNPFRRVLGFTFNDFVPALTAEEIAGGEVNHGPRSGTLAHIGYTGSHGGGGGAMEFADEAILFCPAVNGAPNTSLFSDAVTVGRWYLDSTTTPGTTTLFGRMDAEAIGDAGGATPTGDGGGNAQLPSGTTYLGADCHSATLGLVADPNAETASDAWMFAEESGSTASRYQCGPESTVGDPSTCATTCGGKFGTLPSVVSGVIQNPYTFNGLTVSIGASGIPTEPANIEAALAPLLCGTGIGAAWTGQPNCP